MGRKTQSEGGSTGFMHNQFKFTNQKISTFLQEHKIIAGLLVFEISLSVLAFLFDFLSVSRGQTPGQTFGGAQAVDTFGFIAAFLGLYTIAFGLITLLAIMSVLVVDM